MVPRDWPSTFRAAASLATLCGLPAEDRNNRAANGLECSPSALATTGFLGRTSGSTTSLEQAGTELAAERRTDGAAQ
jgi:hypothetical protein